MAPVALRIVKDVSYARAINHESRFVAGAVFGEIGVASWSAKCCVFQYKMLRGGRKRQLCERTGSVFAISWSDHVRVMLESSAIVSDASTVFGKFLLDFGMQFCVAGAVFGEVGG